jgi:hypothetical protein
VCRLAINVGNGNNLRTLRREGGGTPPSLKSRSDDGTLKPI